MSSLREDVGMLHATMETYAHAKRFNERWLADPAFRSALFQDTNRAIDDYALPVDVDEARGIVEGNTERAGSLARGIYAIAAVKSSVMKRWYGPEATAADPRIAAWRTRQQARMRLELGAFQVEASVRAAWNAELTHGCSGGCWFCNMDAVALSGVAPSDDDALETWRACLRQLQRRLGPAMRTGFLDGATDPFDHPRYEAFCRAVVDEAGFFPPTSTALALRDPQRSRRFFAEARAAGCWSLRLTVRDRAELDALHRTFTSSELANVQLNGCNPESVFIFSLAGRYRDRVLSDPAFAAAERRKLAFAPWYTVSRDFQDDDSWPLDANTGVVGFTLNLVDSTVSLVVPRPSSNTFPLGFARLDTRPFSCSASFGQALDTLIERWMPQGVRDTDHVAFWTGLRSEEIADGVRLHGRFRQSVDIVDPGHAHKVQAMARRLANGTMAGGIAGAIGAEPAWCAKMLQAFFDAGTLEESAG